MAAMPRIIPIERVPLVGGALCLDFINTNGARLKPRPRERLLSYADLLVFGARTGVLDRVRAGVLRREAARRGSAAARALARAKEVREVCFRIFQAVARHAPAAGTDLEMFNSALGDAAGARRVVWARGGPRWEWAAAPTELGQLLAPILHSAGELLGAPDELALLKQCGECDWLFLDLTKNHSRQWCKKTCADRVKSRRYYRRHKKKGK